MPKIIVIEEVLTELLQKKMVQFFASHGTLHKIIRLHSWATQLERLKFNPSVPPSPPSEFKPWNKRTLCTVLYLRVGLFQMQTAKVTVIVKDSNVTLNMPTRCGHPIKGDVEAIEKVQKRATKLVTSLKITIYGSSIVHLGLPTLKYRRLRGDMIEVFKITKHKYDYKIVPELIYNINKVTRGNDFRLSKIRSHYDLSKFSFTNRIVNIWNSLPNAVVDVELC